MKTKIIVRGKIKRGVTVFHDFASFLWPACKPPLGEYEHRSYCYRTLYPDAIFTCEWVPENNNADGHIIFKTELNCK